MSKFVLLTTLAVVTARPQVQQQPGGFGGNQGIGLGVNPQGGMIPPVPGGLGGTNNLGGVGGNRWGQSLLDSLELTLKRLIGNLAGNIQHSPGVNQSALTDLANIIKNDNLTKSQMEEQLTQWASRQSSETKTMYDTAIGSIMQEIKNISAQLDAKAATLSPAAQDAYQRYKAVLMDNSLNRQQECQQIETITQSLNDTVRQELYQAFGMLRMCQGRNSGHGQGGFGGQNQGGFGGQQNGFGGFNGGFNGQPGGFGGNQGGFGGQQGGFQQGGFGGFNGGFNGQPNGFGGNQNGLGGFPGGFGGQQSGFGNGQQGGQQFPGGFGGQQSNFGAPFGQNGFGSNQFPPQNQPFFNQAPFG